MLNLSSRKVLPMYRQAEASECAHACLAMVLSYHGHELDLAALRRKFPTSASGTRLKSLMEMGSALKLDARPVKAPIEMLDQLDLPAILHWDMNHFVVLKAVKRGKHIIHDPARGEVSLTLDEINDSYTGVALMLAPQTGFKKKREVETIGLTALWSSMSGVKRAVMHALLMTVVMQLFILASPFFLQVGVDHILLKNDEALLLTLAIGFGLFALINAAAELVRSYVLLAFGNSMSFTMASNLFTHMIKLPLPFFERRHVGDIVSRFGSTAAIRTLFTDGLIATLIDGVMALVTLGLMLVYSPLLAGIAVAVLVLYLVLRLSTYRAFRSRSEDAIHASAAEQSVFMESVRGMMSVKVFGREDDRSRLWQNKLASKINADVRVGRFGAWFGVANSLLFGIENVILVFVAIKMVLAAQFSVGMIFAFMAYKRQFTTKASALVERLIEFKMLDLHLERISDIALADPEENLDAVQRGLEPSKIEGKVTLDEVSFQYAPTLPMVFKNVSLEIKAGETVAFVGQSGGGKTTLIKTILGLFTPSEGRILIDGKPLADMGLSAYRAQTAAVMQDDTLFAGSISENIAFFDSAIDMARVAKAAQAAAIHQEIAAMPMGYETLVGDMGSTLSGGQKQRVLLARALYREPRILVMDEGTAHLDVGLEAKVNASIKAMGITRIIVAHRPETIRTADTLYHVGHGSVRQLNDAERQGLGLEAEKKSIKATFMADDVQNGSAVSVRTTESKPEPTEKPKLLGIQAPSF